MSQNNIRISLKEVTIPVARFELSAHPDHVGHLVAEPLHVVV